MKMHEALALWRQGTLAIKPTPTRCNKCHRDMPGTTASDGACACGGLIEAKPEEKLVQVETKSEAKPEEKPAQAELKLDPDKPSVNDPKPSSEKVYRGQYNTGFEPTDAACPMPSVNEVCHVCGWMYGCRDSNRRPGLGNTVVFLPKKKEAPAESKITVLELVL